MIVLRTLARGVVTHAGIRSTEWLGAVPLLGLGWLLYSEPGIFDRTASFAMLSRWGDQATWANILLAVSLARLLALLINGSFRSFTHSPTIRFLASWAGGIFWALFTMGIYIAWRDLGGSPTGVAAYGTLMLLEIRNTYVSRADMIITRGTADAGTER